jgi:hypothetical protein
MLAMASTGRAETRVVGAGQAYTSIQPALDASGTGDSVLVMAGTYTEMITLRSNVVLLSADGPEATVIASPGPASGYRGLVHATDTGPLIEDNVVRDNTVLTTFDGWTFGGGGVTSWDSSVIVRRNLVEGNRVQYGSSSDRHFGGGGVLCLGDDGSRPSGPSGVPEVVIADNVIRDNVGGPGGGLLVDDPLARVVGNEITGNLAERGGGIYVAFTRNTIVDNVCLAWDGGAAVALADAGTVQASHNIIAGTAVGYGFRGHPEVDLTFTCNDLFGNELGSVPTGEPEVVGIDGNFAADPLFCGTDDLTIREDSPCAPTGACGLVGRFDVGCASPRADVSAPGPAAWVHAHPTPPGASCTSATRSGPGASSRCGRPQVASCSRPT